MKRIKWLPLLILVISCLAITLSACGGGSDDEGKLDNADSSKILVAYFSCTNHTESVAEKIADVTGGTLYEIEPAEPYSAADLNYNDSNSRSTKEQNDDSARPEISGVVENMADYEVIYLGYPIWWGEAPRIIYTFLESYDFSGKTIVPFCTSGGSGITASVKELKNLDTGATWLNGNKFSSSVSKSEVEAWINSLNG